MRKLFPPPVFSEIAGLTEDLKRTVERLSQGIERHREQDAYLRATAGARYFSNKGMEAEVEWVEGEMAADMEKVSATVERLKVLFAAEKEYRRGFGVPAFDPASVLFTGQTISGFPGSPVHPSTYCPIRKEAIKPDELHAHYTTPEGKPRCDKVVGVATREVPVQDADSGEVVTTLKYPYDTVAERYVKNGRWAQYGLSVDPGTPLEEGIKSHDAVADYLDSHPDVAARYKPDQTGELKYFEVLGRALMGDLVSVNAYNLPPRGMDYEIDPKRWTCEEHLTPVPDIPEGRACPVCGREKAE